MIYEIADRFKRALKGDAESDVPESEYELTDRYKQIGAGKPAFDPEGSGYDYDSANKAGIEPDETGHWASRDPQTGLLLKGRGHETWHKTVKGEEEAGHEITQKDGRYYSFPKEEKPPVDLAPGETPITGVELVPRQEEFKPDPEWRDIGLFRGGEEPAPPEMQEEPAQRPAEKPTWKVPNVYGDVIGKSGVELTQSFEGGFAPDTEMGTQKFKPTNDGKLTGAYGLTIGDPVVENMITPQERIAGLTEDRAKEISQVRYDLARDEVGRWLGEDFEELPQSVKEIVVDMNYTMGQTSLSDFSEFRKALKNKDYDRAADELKYSDGVTKDKTSDYFNDTGRRAKWHYNTLKDLAGTRTHFGGLLDRFFPVRDGFNPETAMNHVRRNRVANTLVQLSGEREKILQKLDFISVPNMTMDTLRQVARATLPAVSPVSPHVIPRSERERYILSAPGAMEAHIIAGIIASGGMAAGVPAFTKSVAITGRLIQYGAFWAANRVLDKLPRVSETQLGEWAIDKTGGKVTIEMLHPLLPSVDIPTKTVLDALQTGTKFWLALQTGKVALTQYNRVIVGMMSKMAPQAAIAVIRRNLDKSISKWMRAEGKRGGIGKNPFTEEQMNAFAEAYYVRLMRQGGIPAGKMAKEVDAEVFRRVARKVVGNQGGWIQIAKDKALSPATAKAAKMSLQQVADFQMGEVEGLPMHILAFLHQNGYIQYFMGDKPIDVEKTKPEWYSKLEGTVRDKMGKSMPADQLKKMLEGQGVSPREMEAYGLDEFLKQPAAEPASNLEEEAKKYKSAEEFVKGQRGKGEHEVFYGNVGDKSIEFIKNPTSSEIRSFDKDIREKFGSKTKAGASLRFTYDDEGNKYVWSADTLHSTAEPLIEKIIGKPVNQNEWIFEKNLTDIWNKAQKPAKPGQVSKQALLDHIAENKIEVQETVLGDPKTISKEEARTAFKSGIEVYGLDFENNESLIQSEWDLTHYDRFAYGKDFEAGRGAPKFNSYLTEAPVGENYREVYLSVPVQQDAKFKEWFKQNYGADQEGNIPDLSTFPPEQQAKMTMEYGGYRVPSSHATGDPKADTNRVAHIFMADELIPIENIKDTYPDLYKRAKAEGRTHVKFKKVWEMQSDWAREARERGFAGTLEEAKQHFGISDENWNKLSQEEKQSYRDEMGAGRGVPYNPLLKKWQELALKKVLRIASEGGYDGITWSSGEQVADRYDLSKHIDKIEYNTMEEILRGWDKNGDIVIDEDVPDTMEALEQHLGKEVARKLDEQDEYRPGTNTKVLQGQDIRVGGEWAKNLYDKQIPNILKKLTKGQVEGITTDTGKALTTATYERIHGEIPTKTQWDKWVAEQGQNQSITLPKATAEKVVREGQPLFLHMGKVPKHYQSLSGYINDIYGGINSKSLTALGYNLKEIRESRTGLKVGRGGGKLDDIASEMAGEGIIQIPDNANPADHLLELIKAKYNPFSQEPTKAEQLEFMKEAGEVAEDPAMSFDPVALDQEILDDKRKKALRSLFPIAKKKGMLSEKGKIKPQLRRVVKHISGQTKLSKLDPEGIDAVKKILKRLPDPVMKNGKPVPPSLSIKKDIVTADFFKRKFKHPTLIKYLTSQTYYAELLGVKDLVKNLEEAVTLKDIETRTLQQIVDHKIAEIDKLGNTSFKEKITAKIKGKPTSAVVRLRDLLDKHEEAPEFLTPRETELFNWFRNLNRMLLERENMVRKAVGLEPIKYRKAYVRHYADSYAQEILAGRRPIPEGIKYWADKLVGKKVYNPMEIQRKLEEDLYGLFTKDLGISTKAMIYTALKEVYLTEPLKQFTAQLNALSKDMTEYPGLTVSERSQVEKMSTIPADTKKWTIDYVNTVIKGHQTAVDEEVNRLVADSSLGVVLRKMLRPFGRTLSYKPLTNMFGAMGKMVIHGVMGPIPRQIIRNKFQPLQNLALYTTKANLKGFLPSKVDKNLKDLMDQSVFLKGYTGVEDAPKELLGNLSQKWLGLYQWSAISNARQSMKVAYHDTKDLVTSPKYKKLGWADPQRDYTEDPDFLYPSEKEKILKEMEFGAGATQYMYVPLGMPQIFRYKALVPLTRLQSWWMNYFTRFTREAITRMVKGETSYGMKIPWSRRIGWGRYLLIGGSILSALGYKRSFLLGVLPTYLSPPAQLALGMYSYATADSDWEKKRAVNQMKYSWKAFIPGSGSWRAWYGAFSGKKSMRSLFFYDQPKKDDDEEEGYTTGADYGVGGEYTVGDAYDMGGDYTV